MVFFEDFRFKKNPNKGYFLVLKTGLKVTTQGHFSIFLEISKKIIDWVKIPFKITITKRWRPDPFY